MKSFIRTLKTTVSMAFLLSVSLGYAGGPDGGDTEPDNTTPYHAVTSRAQLLDQFGASAAAAAENDPLIHDLTEALLEKHLENQAIFERALRIGDQNKALVEQILGLRAQKDNLQAKTQEIEQKMTGLQDQLILLQTQKQAKDLKVLDQEALIKSLNRQEKELTDKFTKEEKALRERIAALTIKEEELSQNLKKSQEECRKIKLSLKASQKPTKKEAAAAAASKSTQEEEEAKRLLQTQIESLEKEITSKRQQIQRLQEDLEGKERNLASLVTSHKKEKETLEAERISALDQIQALTTENTSLQARMKVLKSDLEAKNPLVGQVQELTSQNTSLQEELERLKARLEPMSSLQESLDQEKAKTAVQGKEINLLKQAHDTLKRKVAAQEKDLKAAEEALSLEQHGNCLLKHELDKLKALLSSPGKAKEMRPVPVLLPVYSPEQEMHMRALEQQVAHLGAEHQLLLAQLRGQQTMYAAEYARTQHLEAAASAAAGATYDWASYTKTLHVQLSQLQAFTALQAQVKYTQIAQQKAEIEELRKQLNQKAAVSSRDSDAEAAAPTPPKNAKP